MLHFIISAEDVHRQLTHLNTNKRECADEIHPKLLAIIVPRRQQYELRSLIQQALSWSRRWDLPLNVSKCQHLSIGGAPGHRLFLSEEAESKLMKKFDQVNDLGIIVNSACTPQRMSLLLQIKLREC